jgi:uncharacterized protein
MRVAVLSDTHMQGADAWFEAVYERHLAPADVLLHCGDITGEPLLDFLWQHPAFYAVAGNMDGWTLRDALPPTRVLELEGLRIGMAHGWGFHGPNIGRSVAQALGPGIDLVCYGHTHVFAWEEYDGVRLLNPGSLTGPRKGPCSLAIVTLCQGGAPEVEKVVVEHQGSGW